MIWLVIQRVFNPISRGMSGVKTAWFVPNFKLGASLRPISTKEDPPVKTAWFVWALRFFTANFLLFDFFAFLSCPIISTFIAPCHVMRVMSIFIVLVNSPIIHWIENKSRQQYDFFVNKLFLGEVAKFEPNWPKQSLVGDECPPTGVLHLMHLEYKPQNGKENYWQRDRK